MMPSKKREKIEEMAFQGLLQPYFLQFSICETVDSKCDLRAPIGD